MSLPMLPGMSFANPARTDFRKSQAFGFRNGVAVFEHQKPGIGGSELLGQTSKAKTRSAALATIRASANSGDYIPAWVAFDRQVLRFYGYFLEGVHESPQEAFRVRKCNILYYLEDDSMEVLEPKTENSGMPQGKIVRRHRIPRPDDADDFYGVHDLNMGMELTIYGRTYRLTGCDEFTRNFMGKIGIELNADEEVPGDDFSAKRSTSRPAREPVGQSLDKEERLKLRKFLQHDRKVLRFFSCWDDRSNMFGDLRYFQILVFLADDTVAVNEVMQTNSGRDPVPQFARRGKLPRPQGGLYTERDFKVGITVNIYGRPFFIYDADSYTREHYQTKFGVTLDTPIEVHEDEAMLPQREIPPYTGFGTEEDSLGSVSALAPKAPRKDFRKYIENDGKVLRYGAKLATTRPEDLDRRFIVSYYLADDTVQVFEPPRRNSGITGGKFLERSKINYRPADFFIGAEVTFFRRPFVLFDADEYALNYMENLPEQFPQSDAKLVFGRLKKQVAANKNALLDLPEQAAADEARRVLESAGAQLTDQELVTVLRRYDSGDRVIDLSRLGNDLLA
eukprot:TRINITY_DN4961_c0_g1_i1.p1 TRINITY_DN4961_c0_g1~~TRINITY_DN4961_c0_g1_i1.p1  ORF type:complete len:564 (+),score=138.45 TRINITY_DN4961_c0_g1_i1:103-1794(+)